VPGGTPNAQYQTQANCPANKAIVTGGWAGSGTTSAGITAIDALVKGSGNTNPLGGYYLARFVNPTNITVTVQVYAVCVTP
jgi:hypothetical protein